MKQKVFLSDIDGTLLKTGHTVSRIVCEAAQRFVDDGGLFAVSTGRAVTAVEKLVQILPINAPCIVSNGAQIYDFTKKQELMISRLDPSVFSLLQTVLEQLPAVSITVYTTEGLYNLRRNQRLIAHGVQEDYEASMRKLSQVKEPFKILFTCDEPDTLSYLNREMVDTNCFEIHPASLHFYELTARGVSKGTAVHWLWGNKYRVFAAGDAPSDLTMKPYCECFFAPNTALPQVCRQAHRLFASPDEGGLAEVLEYVRLLK